MTDRLTVHRVDDTRARQFLSDFLNDLEQFEKPEEPDRAACLQNYLNGEHEELLTIRAELAETRTQLLEAKRFASRSAAEENRLRREVAVLEHQRLSIIFGAGASPAFVQHYEKLVRRYQQQLETWRKNDKLVEEVREVLNKKVIPTVDVTKLEAMSLISAIKAAPRSAGPGSGLRFRRPEPYRNGPLFGTQRIPATGLPREIFGNVVNLVGVTTEEDRSRVSKAGAEEIRGRFAVRLKNGFPHGDVDYDALDPWVPEGAKNVLWPALPDLIPKSSWGASLCNILTKATWETLRRAAFNEAGHRCQMCGSAGRLQAHETWEYYEPVEEGTTGIQKLLEIRALCAPCHDTQHLGFHVSRGKGEVPKKRLRLLNRWRPDEVEIAVRQMDRRWKRRSRFEWRLDISLLKEYKLEVKPAYERLDECYLQAPGGGGVTRLYGAVWKQANGPEIFDPVPSYELVDFDYEEFVGDDEDGPDPENGEGDDEVGAGDEVSGGDEVGGGDEGDAEDLSFDVTTNLEITTAAQKDKETQDASDDDGDDEPEKSADEGGPAQTVKTVSSAANKKRGGDVFTSAQVFESGSEDDDEFGEESGDMGPIEIAPA